MSSQALPQPSHPRSHPITYLLAAAFLGYLIYHSQGRDHFAPLVALQAELRGLSAYGPEVHARIAENFSRPGAFECLACTEIGFPYPLPVIWMGLPVVWAPEPLWLYLWNALAMLLLLAGLWLCRLSPLWVLFLPVYQVALNANINGMLLGITLIAIWALRQQHYHLAGVLTILLGMSKPQAAGVFALVLALILLQHRQWHGLVITGVLVTVASFAVQPDWVQEFIAGVRRYSANLPILQHGVWALPLAGMAAMRRQWWASVALVQVAFPAFAQYYLLTPLVVLGLDRPSGVQNIAIICSFAAALLAPRPLQIVLCAAALTAVIFASPQPTTRFP